MSSFNAPSFSPMLPSSLDETIEICLEDFYEEFDTQPLVLKNVSVELIKSATSSVELSFNNIMCKQTNRVAMVSPLGSSLANMCVEYYEENTFRKHESLRSTLDMSKTLLSFSITKQTDQFLTTLNCLHSSLKFTFEKDKYKSLLFVDVCVEKRNVGFEINAYRKPFFTGRYLYRESCSPHKVKFYYLH